MSKKAKLFDPFAQAALLQSSKSTARGWADFTELLQKK
jgi:hypothetical protein